MNKKIIKLLLESLQIPVSAYEKAEARYYDLGEWFSSSSAKCSVYQPHVYPQGSFRMGTVVRPVNNNDEYDLDVGCRLQYGVFKSTHTQQQLKDMIGADIEGYRKARRIEQPLEEMHRCWRLHYQDELTFHMDAVPSIPEDIQKRAQIKEAMVFDHADPNLAEAVANLAGAVPDDRSPHYTAINPNWHISNSEGYARWFESRMKLAGRLLDARAFALDAAKIDDLPAKDWNSPLQQAVQILKRHRDVMFQRNPAAKPISVIVTTLAAKAYNGEPDVGSALETILTGMKSHVSQEIPRVANPVNPAEDFADKWIDPAYRALNLEQNFNSWVQQAQADFFSLSNAQDVELITEKAKRQFGVTLNAEAIRFVLPNAVPTASPSVVQNISLAAGKPWDNAK